MDVATRVETITPDQLDALFGNVEATATPGADNLIIGSQEPKNPFIIGDKSGLNIPSLDLDKLEKTEVSTEDKKEPEESKEPTSETDKEKENVEDSTDKKEPEENKVNEPTQEEQEQVRLVLKNTVNYLVDKGIWSDFEGREDMEIDSDKYAELAAKQEESKIDDMFSELLDSTGSYGKAIINHIKNGGNPDEIIDIFKEQKQVQNIDTSDEDGAISLIQKYYSEEVGWSKAKIDRYINGLKAEEEGITDEAKELQTKYDKIYEQQVSKIQENEKKQLAERKKVQEEYINTLSTTVDNFEELTDKERRLIKDSVLKFNKKLEDGTPVNDFYMKFYQIQQNPKDYVELIHFVMDKKGYQEKYNKKAETKATDKAWNFVKNNGAVKKNGAGIAQHDTSKSSKIDFSGILKK